MLAKMLIEDIMSQIIICKKKEIRPENLFLFLTCSCSVNLLSIYQKKMGCSELLFLLQSYE